MPQNVFDGTNGSPRASISCKQEGFMSNFGYNSESFLLDGKPVQILSGAIHYFRTVPEYWQDRLLKLKQCGFNTVETYTCWNLHERKEGIFDFSGILDLGRFIDIAADLGLMCIVRPGPYICAEWDFGGLPSWLLRYRDMHIRCKDSLFLEKEERYLEKIFEIIRPRLITNGGNIIMVQVENEYGSYGNDHEYIAHLADFYRNSGINVPLFTSDGPGELYYGGGICDGVLATGNFGSNWQGAFDFMKKYRPNQPLMCSEFWEGWFDSWYAPHHRRVPDDVAAQLDGMLSAGGNVNFYMFCGGTNFAFNNGANMYDTYCATTTSYDYDAALTECGDLTKRYYEVRAVAEKHFGTLPELTVTDTPKKAYGALKLTECAPLFDNLDNLSSPVKSAFAMTMEELGADFGFTLYTAYIDYPVTEKLHIEPVRDRALIFVNGKFAGIKERDRQNDEICINNALGEKTRIDILVENLGRVNYGTTMHDNEKGLVRGARIGQQQIFGWTMYPLTMDDISGLKYVSAPDNITLPAFFKGELDVDGTPCDTFIRLDSFHKGFVKVNGFNIGRYWTEAGPQKTLYVPAPLLHEGINVIEVFELHGSDDPIIEFVDKHDLG